MASDLSITGQIQSETKFENLSRNLKILFKKLQALFKKKTAKAGEQWHSNFSPRYAFFLQNIKYGCYEDASSQETWFFSNLSPIYGENSEIFGIVL